MIDNDQKIVQSGPEVINEFLNAHKDKDINKLGFYRLR